MISKRAFWNGKSSVKGEGDNTYRGKLEHFPPPEPIDSIEEAAERMYTDGFIQFPDLFTAAEVVEVRDWMDRIGDPDSAYEFKDWCFNKTVKADFEREPMWLKLIDRGPVVDILKLAFGARVFVNWGNVWVTGKGREMGIHADHFDIALPEDVLLDERVRIPIFNATLHLYFEDQVEEIGPTLLIPGSHRAGRPPQGESTWRGVAPKMASIKAGGAVLFRHDLWHGAVRNTSDRRRHLIQVRYVEGRDQSHRLRFCAPEIAKQATARQRELLNIASDEDWPLRTGGSAAASRRTVAEKY
jgi:hypothetical protein